MISVTTTSTRPRFYRCLASIPVLAALSLGVFAATGFPAEPPRPNILFVFTDDQPQICMGAMGNPLIDTPNMDAFYRLRGTHIDASLEEASREHGSMDAYIRDGLSLTDDEIEGLRDQLLVSPSS